MHLHVTHVILLKDYRLRMEFNEGKIKEPDPKDELYSEISEPPKEIELIRKVRANPDPGTIEWPNGRDFSPKFPYDAGQEVRKPLRNGSSGK